MRGSYLWMYDPVSTLVPVICFVLAIGAGGIGLVSDCMVAFAAVSDCGNHGGGSAGVSEGNFVFAGAPAANAEGVII